MKIEYILVPCCCTSDPWWAPSSIRANLVAGSDTAVTSDDLLCIVHQDGITEAELLDALCELPYLLARMSSGIVRMRPQFAAMPAYRLSGSFNFGSVSTSATLSRRVMATLWAMASISPRDWKELPNPEQFVSPKMPIGRLGHGLI